MAKEKNEVRDFIGKEVSGNEWSEASLKAFIVKRFPGYGVHIQEILSALVDEGFLGVRDLDHGCVAYYRKDL